MQKNEILHIKLKYIYYIIQKIIGYKYASTKYYTTK